MNSWSTPLLLFAVPAGLAGLAPETWLYDRAAILHGEWWRLFTGHWVHFSASHLGWNLAVLLGAGAWLERLQPGRLLRFVALAAPLLSVSFLAGAPDMQAYGGLSGLATGVVTLLALVQLKQDRAARAWWLAALALVMLKIGVDAAQSVPLLASFGSEDIRVSTFAHVMGALAAAAFFLSRCGNSADDIRRPAVATP